MGSIINRIGRELQFTNKTDFSFYAKSRLEGYGFIFMRIIWFFLEGLWFRTIW